MEDVPIQVIMPVSESHEPSAIENTQFVELKPNHINLGVVTETDEESVVDTIDRVVYISNDKLETIDSNISNSNGDTKVNPDQTIHEPGLEYYSIFYVNLDE